MHKSTTNQTVNNTLAFDKAWALLQYADGVEEKVAKLAQPNTRYTLATPIEARWYKSTGDDEFEVLSLCISTVIRLGNNLRAVLGDGTIRPLPDGVISRAKFLEAAHLAVLKEVAPQEYEQQRLKYA